MATNVGRRERVRFGSGPSWATVRARFAGIAASSLVVASVFTLPATAHADLPAGLDQGTLMPVRYVDQFGGGGILSASAGYAIHDVRTYAEYGTNTYSVVRLSDGATVRQITQDAFDPQPQIAGDTVVSVPDNTNGTSVLETMTDAETGAVTATIQLPPDSPSNDRPWVVHSESSWAAISLWGTNTGQNYLHFLRPDGTDVEASYVFDTTPQWIGGDSSAAYVTDLSGSYQVDPASGAVTTLDFGTPGVTLLGVTADSLVGTKTSYVANNSVLSVITTVVFLSKATLSVTKQFQMQTPEAPDLFPYGDTVADVETTSGVPYRREVLPVDPATGAELDPVLTNVTDVNALGDGRIAAMVADGADGELVVAPESGATRVVTTVPRRAQDLQSVSLWNGQLAASFDGSTGVWATDTAQPSWQEIEPNPGFAVDDRFRAVQTAGGNLLTNTSAGQRVSWDGGSRTLTVGGARLDRSGAYVEGYRADGSGSQIEAARTGQVVSSWVGPTDHVVDGTWEWSGPDAAGNLTAHDVSGNHADRIIAVGASCPKGSLEDVWGRWARLSCGGSVDTAVDLLGAYPSVSIPTGSQLGNGFVAWATVPEPNGIEQVEVLHVMDLATQAEHEYGPLRGAPWPPGVSYAVDGGGAGSVAYVDYDQQARVVNLGWLSAQPTVTAANIPQADLAAPTLAQGPTLPARVPAEAGNIQLRWTFTDPSLTDHLTSGLASYDIVKSTDGGTTWTAPAAWQGMAAASISDSVPANTTACYAAVAHDKAGNTSTRTAAVCTLADGTPPTLKSLTGSSAYPASFTGRATISGRFTDAGGVATYDFEQRSASRGGTLGTWHVVATGRTGASYSTGLLAAGSEACLRMRSRDSVGNVSPWTVAKCTTLPLDDTWMSGGVTHRSTIALGGTYRALGAVGSRVVLAGQYGRQVVVTFLCGPGRATAQVYLGSRSIGTASLGAHQVGRCTRVFTLSGDAAGPVQIVQRSRGVVDVDAIAIGR